MNELRRLDSLFEISLYLILLVPFGMVVVGGGVGPLMGLLFGAGLVGSHVAHRRGFARQSHARMWNALVVLFIAFTIGQLFLTEAAILDAGIRVVLVLILVKLFSRLGERDELQIFALSFLLLASATVVNEGLTFGLLFGAYVLIGTFGLAVFHLRSEVHARPRLTLRSAIPLDRQYVAVLAVMSVLILAASVGIFFVFPRVGLGFFLQQSRDGVQVTGFSDSVELGDHGAVRDNPEVVMRVEFPEASFTPAEWGGLHWRTMTFDHYDGRRWSRSLEGTEAPARGTKRTYHLDEHYPRASGPVRRLLIYLEPIGSNLLPVIWPAQRLEFAYSHLSGVAMNSESVTIDAYGDLRHTVDTEAGLPYRIDVATPPDDEMLRRAEAADPEAIQRDENFLQLPPLSPRVAELAKEVTADATTVHDQVRALEAHLESQFTYTTDLPPVGGSPVESFLFENRRGHCEYFATTMVMLLRTRGIPARLVNGFLGGQWNEVGGYLAVRQGDAHAWVEYFAPGVGWVPVDPTPPTDAPTSSAAVTKMRKYVDAMRMAWNKWVIEYDLSAQIEVFKAIGHTLRPRGLMKGQSDVQRDDEEEAPGAARRTLFGAGALALFLLGFYQGRRLRKRGSSLPVVIAVWAGAMAASAAWWAWFQGDGSTPLMAGASTMALGLLLGRLSVGGGARARQPRVQKAFARVEAAARRAGHARRPDEGPSSFLERLAEAFPACAGPLRAFAKYYLPVRFGRELADAETTQQLEELARTIARRLRG